ncbi:hypothetical protein N8T08_010687 [Aspergillus melleus]|uniref:Uncharacterized protein n=1 Tax=Aspergillus melleus TaxID=138277 RepID=A0ACC3BC53_9EURO|nr:hypothetical protein N8T08_010687 [Aspergillus melleus]
MPQTTLLLIWSQTRTQEQVQRVPIYTRYILCNIHPKWNQIRMSKALNHIDHSGTLLERKGTRIDQSGYPAEKAILLAALDAEARWCALVPT